METVLVVAASGLVAKQCGVLWSGLNPWVPGDNQRYNVNSDLISHMYQTIDESVLWNFFCKQLPTTR